MREMDKLFESWIIDLARFVQSAEKYQWRIVKVVREAYFFGGLDWITNSSYEPIS